ncbi:MAG: hypothetical protein HYX78_15585 [Armatimonadetes bacterium]|nr:hypothetical protein [Armatimonadota bacterium]
MGKILIVVAGIALTCATAAMILQPLPSVAQEQSGYLGTQVCTGCHKATYEEWLLTPHRRTLAEGRAPDRTGCESCHGPGGEHVAGGGDPTKIIRLNELQPKAVTEICLKCHRQQDVLLYRTSLHSSAKVKCTNCHDLHTAAGATMLRNTESKQYSISGLTRLIEDVKQQSNIASTSEEKDKALTRLEGLEKKKADLQKSLDVVPTRNRREGEPELCLTCHKELQAQFNLPTHHPVREGRMQCSDCHNPHGGTRGNLREETINQTCFRCHPEIEGPYVFEHPPVSEDCTICHRPHGSPQNYLLKQTQPFLCLKCHAGPHSRSGTLANGSDAATTSRVPYYYWQCTSCHNRPHGSDSHAAFHY